jgi:hypothetical protein
MIRLEQPGGHLEAVGAGIEEPSVFVVSMLMKALTA